jgi:hypothetical protein
VNGWKKLYEQLARKEKNNTRNTRTHATIKPRGESRPWNKRTKQTRAGPLEESKDKLTKAVNGTRLLLRDG